jgi:CubicO group peptidase (beta-lactamase class C family)
MPAPAAPRRTAGVLAVLLIVALAARTAAPVEANPPAPASDATLAARIDAWLAPLAASDQLSGTLLVARHGSVLFERSYGLANRELGIPFAPSTPSCIASITKPMTIALVCRLVDDRLLHPADSLAKWLPDFPRADRITVSHLLNHRAGIPHRVTTREEESIPQSPESMTALAAKAEFHCEPGERSVYSSTGFAVLARVCELAAGESFHDLLAARVFEPAGMTRSTSPRGGALPPGLAPSYAHSVGGLVGAPSRDLSFLVGAGSVYATPRDLLAFMTAVIDTTLGRTSQMALFRDNGFRWNGITNGYRAFADWHRDTGLQVIWCGNVHVGAIDLVRDAVPKLAAGETLPPAEAPRVVPAAVPRERLLACEGDFATGTGQKFTVTAGDGLLNAGDWLLVATSDSTFFSPQDYGRVALVREAGRVIGFDWVWSGGVLEWRRKP